VARSVAVLAVTGAVSVVTAVPASAHGAGADEAPASNYRSEVIRGTGVDGVSVRTIDAGERVEVVNTSGNVVVVEGYDGEPYLRIGPDGVEQNLNSPATYLNESADGSAVAPPNLDEGPPRWQRVSGESSARWHDHRAHWMGGDPPLVTDRPGERHLLAEWVVPLQVGERRVEIEGTTEWVPAPSPWPWFGVIAAVAGLIVVLMLRRRVLGALCVAALAMMPAFIALTVGAWQANAEAAIGKLPVLALPFLTLSLLGGALVVARSKPSDSLVLAGGVGAAAAALTGFTSIDWLTRSQLPTALQVTTARLAVSAIVGAGVGLAIGAGWLTLRRVRLARQSADTTDKAAADVDGHDHVAVAEPVAPTPEREREIRYPSGVGGEPLASRPEFVPLRRNLLVGAAVVAVLIAAAVTIANSIDDADRDGAAAGLGQLCAALERATPEDVSDVRLAFEGPPHDALHAFAGRTQDEDRTSAGELLRAKQRIEANLGSTPSELHPLLEPLTAAIVNAAAATGDVLPDSCTPKG